MKKLLLSFLLVTGLSTSAQVTVFEDSFETYNDFLITGIGDWQTLDLDGLNCYGVGNGVTWPNNGVPQAWMVFNPSATTPPVQNTTTGVDGATENTNFNPRTGSKYAACWDAALTGGAPVNNDFIISPVINLGTTNNELRFWIKSLSDTYGLDRYRVYVYLGTGTPTQLSDFILISGVPSIQAPYPTWEEKIYSLNTYSNQAIRIAIRCVSADIYMLMMDDFKVTSSNLKVDEFFSNKFSAYPNPANSIVTLSNTDNLLVTAVSISDINGRTVKNMEINNLSEVEMNVAELTSGVYFMNVTTDSGKAVKKFIKN
jgi:hypothetical protein